MSRIGEAANRPPQSSQPQAGASVDPDVFHGQIDSSRTHHEILRGLDGKQVCPFCGSVSEKSASPCARCGMDNTPDARKATKSRIGPWYVLQARNPAAPGMRFETLLSFVRKGRVRARSVVRGPTTHQLWRFAAHVKGLSREFGLCYSCGSAIDAAANVCPMCNRLQEPPLNPDMLLEDGSEEQVKAVYRELPDPADAMAAGHEPEALVPPPPPEEADIIIPAFGGFGHEGPAPSAAVPVTAPVVPPTQFNESPPPASPSSPSSPSSMSLTMSYPPAPPPIPAPSAAPRPAAAAPRPSPAQRPAPAASNENPFAIAPPRKKNGGGTGGDSFLSAKDLAAAFKLSFDPGADMDTVDVPDQVPASAMPEGMRPGAIVPRNPMGAPLATTGAPPRPRKRRGMLAKFVLFVLIVSGTGLGLLMWVDPAFRVKAIDWSKAQWAKLRSFTAGEAGKGGSPAATEPSSVFEEKEPPALTSTPTTVPSSEPTTADEDRSPAEVVAQPAESVNDVVEAPVPAEPVPAAAPKPAQPGRKNAPDARPAPAASGDEPPAAPANVDNFAKMNQLRRAALTAEGKGDFRAALKAWEEIAELPSNVWPGNLKMKLDSARQRSKE